MTKLTIEYMAGFFDGEGGVELSPKKIQDRISVVNTNKTILEYIQETFGGSIISKKISGLSKKPQWVWRLHGRYGVALAKQLHTICFEKKEKLGLFIERNEKNAEGI